MLSVCKIVVRLCKCLHFFRACAKFNAPELKGPPESQGQKVIDAAICARLVSALSFGRKGGFFMSEKRLAVISLIIEDREQSPKINGVLTEYGEYVVGRMGVPYKERGVSVICVIIDAPAEIINTVTGKIGMISGVTAKTLMSKNLQ